MSPARVVRALPARGTTVESSAVAKADGGARRCGCQRVGAASTSGDDGGDIGDGKRRRGLRVRRIGVQGRQYTCVIWGLERGGAVIEEVVRDSREGGSGRAEMGGKEGTYTTPRTGGAGVRRWNCLGGDSRAVIPAGRDVERGGVRACALRRRKREAGWDGGDTSTRCIASRQPAIYRKR
ncbi:hypothetical protein B0H19DRAFT_1084554 [Mycena capillaripes]|nr:hypothetical protein B0H19DRAFT_1084554 [Mycena capillaripes]